MPGGTYFFTVNLLQRQDNNLLTQDIDRLRETVKSVRQRHPFTIHGRAVMRLCLNMSAEMLTFGAMP